MAKKKVPAKARITVASATCEMFATFDLQCPLCGLTIPANTPHKCSKAQ